MRKTNGFIIAAATVVAASAATMLLLSKKCIESASNITSQLMNVNFNLSQTKKDLAKSNAKISDANRILRNLIKDDVTSENKMGDKHGQV